MCYRMIFNMNMPCDWNETLGDRQKKTKDSGRFVLGSRCCIRFKEYFFVRGRGGGKAKYFLPRSVPRKREKTARRRTFSDIAARVAGARWGQAALSCRVEQSGMVSFLAWGHMFYSCSKCCWLDTDVPNVFLSEGGHHAPNPQLFFVKPGPPSPPATLKDQLRPLNRAAQVGFFSEIQFWVCFFLLSQNQTAVSTMVSFVNCILFSRVHFVIGLFWVPHPPPNPQHVNCTFDGTLKA